MKSTMYVVVDCNEQPYEQFDTIEDAYWWAMECWDDYGYPVYIDKIEWKANSKAEVVVQDNDIWFIDDWESYWMDCAEEHWLLWYSLIVAETKKELQLFDSICLRCNLSFNENIRWKQKKWMS